MNYVAHTADGSSINLQATLSAASAMPEGHPVPHHPITCPGPLAFHDDGQFQCEHAAVAADDERTQHCLDHTMALLLIEEATKL